jgi:hypothetical protein
MPQGLETRMSLYSQTVTQMSKMLTNLDAWIGLGVENATSKKYDPSVLLNARLAPDQYNLIKQVQAACDSAKFAAARLTGKTAPAHPDTEQTLDEVRARIKAVVDYLATFTEADFAGGETRVVPLSFMPGKGMLGSDYLCEMAAPNFYFHISMAYAILRHNGIPLGKMNFMGGMKLVDV